MNLRKELELQDKKELIGRFISIMQEGKSTEKKTLKAIIREIQEIYNILEI